MSLTSGMGQVRSVERRTTTTVNMYDDLNHNSAANAREKELAINAMLLRKENHFYDSRKIR